MLTAIYLRIVWTISSNKYERFIDCMICVMKKAVFRIYEKKGVEKPCSGSPHSLSLHSNTPQLSKSEISTL